MSRSITISGEDRDLLYNRILIHLSGIDAVWLAAEEKDFQTAERVSREYCDELRLMIDDLGWGERNEETVELTSPPDVVRRVMERLRADADGLDEEEREVKAALLKREDDNRRVRATCDEILAALEQHKA